MGLLGKMYCQYSIVVFFVLVHYIESKITFILRDQSNSVVGFRTIFASDPSDHFKLKFANIRNNPSFISIIARRIPFQKSY